MSSISFQERFEIQNENWEPGWIAEDGLDDENDAQQQEREEILEFDEINPEDEEPRTTIGVSFNSIINVNKY
jgi:hypothetical protein